MAAIESFLNQRQEQGLLRRLRPIESRHEGRILRNERWLVDLSSNDYLGLSQHPRLQEAAQKAIADYGTGAVASRLLSGDLHLFHDLEERIAEHKQKPAALVFNSGYQANVGIISACCGRGDVVYGDRLIHASCLDGVAQSEARLLRFQHNDPEHLAQLLLKHGGGGHQNLVVTESVFSMDGDLAPLTDIVKVAKTQAAMILVDEAHATGLYGPNGAGRVVAEGLSEQVDLIMGTFSKALGSFGAYVACSETMQSYLINRARSFIYSTALPPSVMAANRAALDVLCDEPERRDHLIDLATWFRTELRQRDLSILGDSQIVPWVIGDAQETIRMSQVLEERGYNVLPVRPPTVPAGMSRLRFSLSALHRRDDLLGLFAILDEVRDV